MPITIENVKARVEGVSVRKLTFEDTYCGCCYEDELIHGFAEVELSKISHFVKNVRMFNNRNIIFDVTIIDSLHGKVLQEVLNAGVSVEYIPLIADKVMYGIHCKPLFKNLKQTRKDKLKEIFKNTLFNDAKG